AIIPGSLILADACCGSVDGIHVHGGMHRGERFAEANVLRNRLIAYLIHEIGAPVPLQAGGIQRVKHALQGWVWQRTYKIECRFFECPDRSEYFFCFLQWPGVCPYDAAHFFHVQMFGKRRCWRHSKKCEETI